MEWMGKILDVSRRFMKVWPAIAALQLVTPVYAVEFEFSGFGSLIAGQSFGPCTPDNTLSKYYQAPCTRFIADWSHAGVYTPGLSVGPESKIGLQESAVFSRDFSATAQVVGRMIDGPTADLEWAYLTYDVTPAWTVQLGRKRLPFYFYSDIQDVGYTYPWVHLPPDVYGWEIVNYDGINATYHGVLAGWAVKSDLFAGSEKFKDNPVYKIYFDDPKVVKWDHIYGTALELNKGWFTSRFTYITSNFQRIDQSSGIPDAFPSGDTIGKQKIYGAAVNVDINPWFIRSEYSVFDRDTTMYIAKLWLIAAGRRIGAFTPMLSISGYREITKFPDSYVPTVMATQSFVLRYELTKSSAIKFQLDRFHDGSDIPSMGNAKAISVSYDFVF